MGIGLHNNVPNNIKKLEEYKPYRRELKSFSHRAHVLFIGRTFLCLDVMIL